MITILCYSYLINLEAGETGVSGPSKLPQVDPRTSLRKDEAGIEHGDAAREVLHLRGAGHVRREERMGVWVVVEGISVLMTCVGPGGC